MSKQGTKRADEAKNITVSSLLTLSEHTFYDAACGILPWFNYIGLHVLVLADKSPNLEWHIDGYARLKHVRNLNKKGRQRTE